MSYEVIDTINQTNTIDLSQAFMTVNTASGNLLGALVLVTVFVGYYFLFGKEQKIDDLLASSFVTMIIATLFLFMGVVTWPIYGVGLSVFLIALMLKFWMS